MEPIHALAGELHRMTERRVVGIHSLAEYDDGMYDEGMVQGKADVVVGLAETWNCLLGAGLDLSAHKDLIAICLHPPGTNGSWHAQLHPLASTIQVYMQDWDILALAHGLVEDLQTVELAMAS